MEHKFVRHFYSGESNYDGKLEMCVIGKGSILLSFICFIQCVNKIVFLFRCDSHGVLLPSFRLFTVVFSTVFVFLPM